MVCWHIVYNTTQHILEQSQVSEVSFIINAVGSLCIVLLNMSLNQIFSKYNSSEHGILKSEIQQPRLP